MEIEANEDFLLLDGENDRRSNNNIKVYADNKITDEIESEYIYIEFKEPIFYREKRYVFAPKTDYYMEMIQNECYLYKIFHYKNNDSNIIILDFPDLSQVLKKKKYKEYIVTIVLSYEDRYNPIYYFYNPAIITISQKLLDKDYNSITVIDIIAIIVGIIFGLCLLPILVYFIYFVILCCIRKTTDPMRGLYLEDIGPIN